MNKYHLKPQYYTVKLEFTGVCFLPFVLFQNKNCGYSLYLFWHSGSNKYPQSMLVFGVLQWFHLNHLIANGTIGKEIGANGNTIGINGTNVTTQWYHWKDPEHPHFFEQNMKNTILYRLKFASLLPKKITVHRIGMFL